MQELSYQAERNWPKKAQVWLQRRAPASYGMVAALLLVGLMAAIYQEENWRGKRAWEQCKRQLASKGAVLDWRAWTPAPIPDSENVFEAPEIKDWFAPWPNSVGARLLAAMAELPGKTSNRPVLAHVRILPPEKPMAAGEADFVLRYVPEGRAVFLEQCRPGASTDAESRAPKSSLTGSSASESVPLVVLDQVPLPDAVRNLSRHGGLNCVLDPKLLGADPETGEVPRQLPGVSIRLQHVTAEQALIAVLNRYGFELVPARRGEGRHVRLKEEFEPWLWASLETREALQRALESALGRAIAGVQRSVLLSRAVDQVKPIRIDLRTEQLASEIPLGSILPPLLLRAGSSSRIQLSFEQVATNAFEVRAGWPVYIAADYLAWTDQFRPEFQAVRDALRRPHERLAGDCKELTSKPRTVVLSIVHQMLEQRAQAHLLLGEPEAALEPLSLAHELLRLWETRPLDRVAGTRNLALTRTWVDVVADGLRLGAWREPQLAVLERQLQEIDLPPMISEALQYERAVSLRTMGLPADELGKVISHGTMTNLWQVFRYPAFIVAKLAPRGWRYENMALAAELQQKSIEIYDARQRLIVPSAREAADREIHNAFHPWRPRTCLASVLTPDRNDVWVMTARAQTEVKEAVIACALQRYRMAKGHFPDALGQLVPQFIESLPRDVLSGHGFSYGRVDSSRFVLYSPGWNLTDEGGLIHPRARTDATATEGDWVWPFGV